MAAETGNSLITLLSTYKKEICTETHKDTDTHTYTERYTHRVEEGERGRDREINRK